MLPKFFMKYERMGGGGQIDPPPKKNNKKNKKNYPQKAQPY